ncbi:MAG: hypothetical protein BWY74_00179 [Firmicutes bacterium ADurb.Bin419]|nr:MAG: hypothetical protein BWY74_00179 [Firmicutes bacterium ADurb.Bin419]
MITFIDYQYKGIGGVGQLVVNTTMEMNKRGELTKVYCSKRSYEYKCLIELNADFIHIDSDDVNISRLRDYLCAEDVIILTHIGETFLLEEIKVLNNKLLFYCVFPDTFFTYQPFLNPIFNQRRATLDFIDTLYVHKSLLIMDWPNVKAIYDRGGKEFKVIPYLPVPVTNHTGLVRKSPPSNASKITYIGRGNDEWKIFPVIKLLEDMNHGSVKTSLTIITDSNDLFIDMIQKYIPCNIIEVEYINNLHGEKLERYLFENSFLHIAMGTSALEGAKLGIPTILIDYSKHKFPDYYKFRWIYQSEDYCLGGEIKDGVIPYDTGKSLKEMLDSISFKEGYTQESESCRKYVNNNHSIEYFVSCLEEACKQTSMTTQLYCNTKFSKNLYLYQTSFIRNVASKIKHALIKNRYDI